MLPERQQRFVRLYAVNGGNGARAARGARYAVASSSRSGGAVELDRSAEDMLREAVGDLFQKHGRPRL